MWGRRDEGVIDAIPKGKAEKPSRIIRMGVENSKKARDRPAVVQERQSPIDALKMKYANGEITKDEFEEKKKILEGRHEGRMQAGRHAADCPSIPAVILSYMVLARDEVIS